MKYSPHVFRFLIYIHAIDSGKFLVVKRYGILKKRQFGLFNEINFHDNKHDNASIMHSVDNDYFHGCKSYYDTKIVENVKQTQFHSYDGNAKGYSDERNKYRERGSRTNQAHWTTSRISSAQNNT